MASAIIEGQDGQAGGRGVPLTLPEPIDLSQNVLYNSMNPGRFVLTLLLSSLTTSIM